MDVEPLLAEERAGWEELRSVLDRIPLDRIEEPGVTPEGWSPKDVMFHVGAWCAECANQLEQIRLGTFVNQEDWEEDRRNREWFETSRRLDVSTVRAELHTAHARMLREWEALSEITPAAWEWFEESGSLHYAEHVRDLRGWLEGREPDGRS